MAAEAVAPLRFGPAASPHLAARLAGTDLDFETLVAAARGGDHEARGDGGDRDRGGDDGGGDDDGTIVIVEGVGGLLVPLTDDRSVCDSPWRWASRCWWRRDPASARSTTRC